MSATRDIATATRVPTADGIRRGEGTPMHDGTLPLARLSRSEQASFRRIYIASFPLFLAAAVIARLVAPLASGRTAGQRRSVFGEAKALADSTIPFAFMK
ncbi:hypothetical protein EDC22_11436 [Tepidamorphus gemmatus]|uniref:Uncharacterized protein n=1 Tax=Tepidamorphus gemmatus TaxID=747076 RepID=A0A4R3LWG9_9HYPH|nr:hypothetical protein [Tepidamorphus gemmatus]TCT04942.1 hypothetical protein EDC22_11436 [Tepidamorphus gemmatus]